MPLPAPGDLAPSFTAPGLDGVSCRLDEALGQGPVLLCFFKSECGASDLTLPFVEKVHLHHLEDASPEGAQLTVLGVSQDDQATTADLVKGLGLSFRVLVEGEACAVSRAYEIDATPTLFLLAGEEKLRSDAARVPAEEGRRIRMVMEGWNRSAFNDIIDEIAARVGALPAEPFAGFGEVPEHRPG